ASAVGEVGGAIAGAAVGGPSPAGFIAKGGKTIAELGEGANLAGRIVAGTAAGAAEGAAYGAGSYVSDVALGARDLSASNFVAAMGHGALWGAVPGGALSIGSESLAAARRMFPAEDITAEAAAKAEQEATQEIGDAVKDGHDLEGAGKTRVQQIREERAAGDLKLAQELNAIKIRRAQEIAEADAARARAVQQQAEERLTTVQQREAAAR